MHVESRSQPLSYKPSESTGRPFASIVQRNSFTTKPVASKYVAPLASTSAAGLALRVVDYIGDGVQVVSLGVNPPGDASRWAGFALLPFAEAVPAPPETPPGVPGL